MVGVAHMETESEGYRSRTWKRQTLCDVWSVGRMMGVENRVRTQRCTWQA